MLLVPRGQGPGSACTEAQEKHMPNLKLDIGFWKYDRTRALENGTVTIEGVDATFHTAPVVTEIFRALVQERSLDVAELGLTYYLRTFQSGRSPLVALPIFPNRAFRHSSIFVSK